MTHDQEVGTVAFSPDGKYVASGVMSIQSESGKQPRQRKSSA
jgi:WD40 repeat protein